MAPPSPREHQSAPATSATKPDAEMVLPGFPDADSFVKVSSRALGHPWSPLFWPEAGPGLRASGACHGGLTARAESGRRAPRFRRSGVNACGLACKAVSAPSEGHPRHPRGAPCTTSPQGPTAGRLSLPLLTPRLLERLVPQSLGLNVTRDRCHRASPSAKAHSPVPPEGGA